MVMVLEVVVDKAREHGIVQMSFGGVGGNSEMGSDGCRVVVCKRMPGRRRKMAGIDAN